MINYIGSNIKFKKQKCIQLTKRHETIHISMSIKYKLISCMFDKMDMSDYKHIVILSIRTQ